MRSALQCVFIALFIVHRGSRAIPDDDFRPTPIPIDKWHDKHEGRLGTLQEIVATETPSTVAAVPAHYWEDALRHSVYLTLVRDKIDQLIAKGAAEPQDNKPEPISKEDDDRDMWEKIKSAPFDRIVEVTGAPVGDITVIAKGRLLEEKYGYRFAEDEITREKCRDEKCMRDVKAFWSVKRVRQRDSETHPGNYHYELTFSVSSQTSKKERKPYENPVRTFTVRENSKVPENTHIHTKNVRRPQREVWVHKNIVPTKHYQSRQYNQGLDRFFSSLFSEEDAYEPPRYKQQSSFMRQPFLQLSKVGNVETFEESRKFVPYPYKPQSYKHSRYPIPTPPQSNVQPYIDFEETFNKHYPYPQDDHRYMPSNIIKTTRPAFLPTPVIPTKPISLPPKNNFTINILGRKNLLENTTQEPDFLGKVYKNYNRATSPKPTPVRVNYFPDHVRPPVFNAPPGVFVTMDNKPFKPMPPLKLLHSSKPSKSKPLNFRPSPQILDAQFLDSDSSSGSAFKPITLGYTENTTRKESSVATTKTQKSSSSTKKTKNRVNSTTTTTAPDIITAHSDSLEENDTMEWANLLGAFTRTTPMASQKNKTNTTASIQASSTTPVSTTEETTTEAVSTSTTTLKPTKRTRPPPKFTKPSKIKKHKRVTTSTTSTTTDTPKTTTIKAIPDLTPQASSAATNDKFTWKSKNKTASTTPLTTSTSTFTTTTKPTITRKEVTIKTTTITPSSTNNPSTSSQTTEVKNPATTQPKYKNRYRQSTLMQKGTSVKHDRWSAPMIEKNKTTASYKSNRRNESNFQGYSSTTSRSLEVEQNERDATENLSNSNANDSRDSITTDVESTSKFQSKYEDSADKYEVISTTQSSKVKENETIDEVNKESKEHNIKDENEFIFNVTSTSIENSNEIEQDNSITTERIINTSTQSVATYKKRCKKRKHHNATSVPTITAEETTKNQQEIENEITTTVGTTTTGISFTSGFLDEILHSINTDTSVETKETIHPLARGDPESLELHTEKDEDFEELLDSLEGKNIHDDETSEEDYEDDNSESSVEHLPFNNEENRAIGSSNDDYNDYQDRPYTLFELMAME